MNKLFAIAVYFSLLSGTLPANAQDPAALIHEAGKLELAYKDVDALQKYLQVLSIQPSHMVALCKTSELYNLIGRRIPDKEKQRTYYHASQTYAERALKANPNNSEANFVMALSLGRMAQTGSGQSRINAVKLIRQYAERCIQLDPNNFKGYHVLGKWNLEVSNLSSFEKWLVKMAYGALPPASLDNAIINYEKSRQLNPAFQLNYLELARAYHKKDLDAKSLAMLKTVLAMPNHSADDQRVHKEAKELLEEVQ
jgi:tetratricopeptide (TPR) repeat protein